VTGFFVHGQNLITADEQQKREQAEQKRLAEEERKESAIDSYCAVYPYIFNDSFSFKQNETAPAGD